jgi:host factor-I protein
MSPQEPPDFCYCLSSIGLVQLTKTYKMAQDNIHRLQDTFLEHLQRKRTPVTIFLSNGVRLQGIVADFDAFCVLLESDGRRQIVYKHAITTTSPASAVDLQDKSGPAEKIQAAKPALIVERRGRSRLAR